MSHPFELSPAELTHRMDEMIDVTFGDLESQFLVLPKGNGFVEYRDFQAAYEVLKSHTNGFRTLTKKAVWAAFEADSLAFVVMRAILGFQPPEWAELARDEVGSDISTGAARTLDVTVRRNRQYLKNVRQSGSSVPRSAPRPASELTPSVACSCVPTRISKDPLGAVRLLGCTQALWGEFRLLTRTSTEIGSPTWPSAARRGPRWGSSCSSAGEPVATQRPGRRTWSQARAGHGLLRRMKGVQPRLLVKGSPPPCA